MIPRKASFFISNSKTDLLAKIAFGIGIAVSLTQYGFNRSIWLDEGMLAINFFDANFIDLLQPLQYNQVAPVLFLLVEKLLFQLIPHPEYALRLFPLLLFWGSLFLFSIIIGRVFRKKNFQIIVLLLFAVNYNLVYYSSEVKQYMGDVFCYLLLIFFAQVDLKSRTYFIRLLALGVCTVFLSHAAPFFLCAVVLYLFFRSENPISFKRMAILGSTWLLTVLLHYLMFAYHHPATDFMLNFWNKTDAFMPMVWDFDKVSFFFSQKFIMITRYMLQLDKYGKYVLSILVILGIYRLAAEEKRSFLILLLLPISIHLFISGLKLYPFELRLLLYSFPVWLILGFKGIESTYIFAENRKARYRNLVYLFPIWWIGSSMFSFYQLGFPIKNSEIKVILAHVSKNIRADESLFVTTSSTPAFTFYQKSGFFSLEPKQEVIFSKDDFWKFSESIEQMKRIDGKFWLIASQTSDKFRDALANIMDNNGFRVWESCCGYNACVFYLSYPSPSK